MELRLATSLDIPAISTIVERAYHVYVDQIGRRPAPMDDDHEDKVRRGQVVVADHDGVVGLIVLVMQPDHVFIENLAVDPRFQGTGVGRALLGHAEAQAREHRVSELRLYTNVVMTRSLAFYARLGFREDGRRFDHGFQRVFLSKRVG